MNYSFGNRAESMGLIPICPYTFEYIDRYSCVSYEYLQTIDGKRNIPYLGVFTKNLEDSVKNYKLVGIVSDYYKFEGNEKLIKGVIEFLNEYKDLKIIKEKIVLSQFYSRMMYVIAFSSDVQSLEIGDIFPTISIFNSYDGKGSQDVRFGITILSKDNDKDTLAQFNFTHSIIDMRKIHIENSKTNIINVDNYVSEFAGGIVDFIKENMNNKLSFKTVLDTLETIEKLGKKKRIEVANNLNIGEDDDYAKNGVISSWDMFLAISKYTAKEGNINMKNLLDNIVEKILILPEKMVSALKIEV